MAPFPHNFSVSPFPHFCAFNITVIMLLLSIFIAAVIFSMVKASSCPVGQIRFCIVKPANTACTLACNWACNLGCPEGFRDVVVGCDTLCIRTVEAGEKPDACQAASGSLVCARHVSNTSPIMETCDCRKGRLRTPKPTSQTPDATSDPGATPAPQQNDGFMNCANLLVLMAVVGYCILVHVLS